MLVEKKMLSDMDLESQVALELPDREMLLVTVVIANVLNNLSVDIEVRDINVAAQICAAVLTRAPGFTCSIDGVQQ
jgi:hypothetical protein